MQEGPHAGNTKPCDPSSRGCNLAVAVAAICFGHSSERLFDVLAAAAPGGLAAVTAGYSCAHSVSPSVVCAFCLVAERGVLGLVGHKCVVTEHGAQGEHAA